MSAVAVKYRELTDMLYTGTVQKLLKWRYDGDDRSVFVRVAGKTVSMKISSNDDFEPLCEVDITNSEGDFLEGFNDELLHSGGGIKPKVGNFETYYALMSVIYDMAKRQATGADEALDEILSALKATTETAEDDWEL